MLYSCPSKACSSPKKRGNIDMMMHYTSIPLLTLLLERGEYSHQLYVGDVNHRNLDLQKIRFSHGNNCKPLVSSFARKTSIEDFRMGPYLSLFIHGIEEVDKRCSNELRSMCEIHWPEHVAKDKNCPLFG